MFGHDLQIENMLANQIDGGMEYHFVLICRCCLQVAEVKTTHDNNNWNEL